MNAEASTTGGTPSVRLRIMGGFVGNVVEWYDFALYGYLAGVIAPVFFPPGNPTAGLIATYGIFAAGFLMRPIGAAVFGWFGDRHGRARTMQISVAMMAVPTLLLGVLPSYERVGLWAPVLLVLVRLTQGLSVGGEFSSSATYLVETAPEGKRGLTGSWTNVGSMTGSLLGVGAAALVTGLFEAETLTGWAWRLPFLGGAVLGVAAILVRRGLHDSEHFAAHQAARDATSPLLEAFTTNRRETVLAVAFASAYGACFYLAFVYLPEWLSGQELMDRGTALTVNAAMTVLVIPAMPLLAIVGDRYVPRRTWIALSMLGLAVAAWPLFVWMEGSDGSLASVVAAQAIVFALLAVPLSSAPALFVEMFPERDRLSGYSVAFNLGVGVFGGTTPMIATSLIAATGIATMPALYLAVAGLSAVSTLAFRQIIAASPCAERAPAALRLTANERGKKVDRTRRRSAMTPSARGCSLGSGGARACSRARPGAGLRRGSAALSDDRLIAVLSSRRSGGLFHPGPQFRDRVGAAEAVSFVSGAEHDQGRDSWHCEASLGSWCIVDVDLDELQPAGVFGGELLEHGRDGSTWPAPRRPKVDEDPCGVRDLVEVAVVPACLRAGRLDAPHQGNAYLRTTA